MRLINTPFMGLFLLLLASTVGHTQTCNDRVQATTPDSRFEMSGNEVKDLQTGLIWQRCSVGQSWGSSGCSGSATTYIWSDALSLATGDWRLPNLKELTSIVETACYNPAINLTVFPGTPNSWYWSSSPYAYLSGNAWVVLFSYGNDGTYAKNDGRYVRLVRGGQ